MEINYDKLLDDWAELILSKADKLEESANYIEEWNFLKGRSLGVVEGYRLAVTHLNMMEKKWKKMK